MGCTKVIRWNQPNFVKRNAPWIFSGYILIRNCDGHSAYWVLNLFKLLRSCKAFCLVGSRLGERVLNVPLNSGRSSNSSTGGASWSCTTRAQSGLCQPCVRFLALVYRSNPFPGTSLQTGFNGDMLIFRFWCGAWHRQLRWRRKTVYCFIDFYENLACQRIFVSVASRRGIWSFLLVRR